MNPIKVKIFKREFPEDLQDDINEFINEKVEDCDCVDIKFVYGDDWYTAMILYR
jgi:Sporulation protein Cse60